MSHMFFKNIEENNNIIYVDTNKFAKISKNKIDSSLYVWWWIFETHHDDVKLFLFSMWNDDKFMSVCKFYQLLMKKTRCVENENEFAFDDDWNNVWLKKHKINIDENDFV